MSASNINVSFTIPFARSFVPLRFHQKAISTSKIDSHVYFVPILRSASFTHRFSVYISSFSSISLWSSVLSLARSRLRSGFHRRSERRCLRSLQLMSVTGERQVSAARIANDSKRASRTRACVRILGIGMRIGCTCRGELHNRQFATRWFV